MNRRRAIEIALAFFGVYPAIPALSAETKRAGAANTLDIFQKVLDERNSDPSAVVLSLTTWDDNLVYVTRDARVELSLHPDTSISDVVADISDGDFSIEKEGKTLWIRNGKLSVAIKRINLRHSELRWRVKIA